MKLAKFKLNRCKNCIYYKQMGYIHYCNNNIYHKKYKLEIINPIPLICFRKKKN